MTKTEATATHADSYVRKTARVAKAGIYLAGAVTLAAVLVCGLTLMGVASQNQALADAVGAHVESLPAVAVAEAAVAAAQRSATSVASVVEEQKQYARNKFSNLAAAFGDSDHLRSQLAISLVEAEEPSVEAQANVASKQAELADAQETAAAAAGDVLTRDLIAKQSADSATWTYALAALCVAIFAAVALALSLSAAKARAMVELHRSSRGHD